MIQTRTLSVSDSSSVPTQPLGFRLSRSNSALIAAGHSVCSEWAAFLSSMLRAMAFLRSLLAQYNGICGRQEPAGRDVTSQEANSRRALVIGGSMSGLFAGLMLRRRGFAVDIYERVESELSGRGAGIVAQPVVARTLRDARASAPPISASR